MHKELKQRACAAIDAARPEICVWGERIASKPELGFKEHETSKLVRGVFDSLGIAYECPLALTGVKGKLSGQPGPLNVCPIGEMDAIPCVGHPSMDSATGAAHACGHNAQIAALLGAALGLAKSRVMEQLYGNAVFFAVPPSSILTWSTAAI